MGEHRKGPVGNVAAVHSDAGTTPAVGKATLAAPPLPRTTQELGPSTMSGVQGFVDNSNGAAIYDKPNGQRVQAAPLPPCTRVFVSGQHSRWRYVTAYLDHSIVQGCVEDFRITTDMPEPLAELRQLVGGETVEGLAREKFGRAVTDGHDLRYYENVLLYANRGRAGIKGTYQDPTIFGGGSNNIQLFAGHRIWLVSPEYAKALQGEVPSGSLTGGGVAKAKRFAVHLEDILLSVTESYKFLDEVGGEFAQAIRDHMASIIGITAGFLTFEVGSMLLATVPSGVSQIAAAVIQLALTAFGAAGMVEASWQALKHGANWLTGAWTAAGRMGLVIEASKEFLRMLIALAMAVLAAQGAKGNYANALKIARSMPTNGLPMFATVGSGSSNVGAAGAAVGPGAGAFGAAGTMSLHVSDKDKEQLGEGPEVDALTERNPRENRRRERREDRSAEREPRENRSDLARHIPPRGEAFTEWFDSLSLEELDALLADRDARHLIGDNIRYPGGQHEWLMVAEVRQFKKWGISMKTIQEGRTPTAVDLGAFMHKSGRFHQVLRTMITSSDTFADFLAKLNKWADGKLVPAHSERWPNDHPQGRYSLPNCLQLKGQA